MSTKIYSYILRFDDGAAPNPYWGTCTLAICKPAIRRTAQIGDWVLGTGSVNSRCNDGVKRNFSQHLVYAMKVTDKMTLAHYNDYCQQELTTKIPVPGHDDWRLRMGDCIYFDAGNIDLELRPFSIHDIYQRPRDQRGVNVLLSNDFYYFGEKAEPIPGHLLCLIKKNQGHLKIDDAGLLSQFEEWIRTFEQNKLHGEPQLKHAFDKPNCNISGHCTSEYIAEDENETEEILGRC